MGDSSGDGQTGGAAPFAASLAACATAAERCALVQSHVRTLGQERGRLARDVTLIAVSKTFGADAIEPVVASGQRHFGENRVQEAQGKWPALRAAYPDVTLHLIGPLQSNKAKDAAALFDVIHTIDRPKIVTALQAAAADLGRVLDVFIQVNTGDEAQKAGVSADDLEPLAAQVRAAPNLTLAGLMCIPPVDDEPAIHFALLRKLGREIGTDDLSMGMTGDFPTAIEFDATYIRVGSAIFGAREKPSG